MSGLFQVYFDLQAWEFSAKVLLAWEKYMYAPISGIRKNREAILFEPNYVFFLPERFPFTTTSDEQQFLIYYVLNGNLIY